MHHYLQPYIQCTMKMKTTNLTQGKESKLKENILQRAKNQGKNRVEKGQGQGQSHKLLFCPYYFVQYYILFIHENVRKIRYFGPFLPIFSIYQSLLNDYYQQYSLSTKVYCKIIHGVISIVRYHSVLNPPHLKPGCNDDKAK